VAKPRTLAIVLAGGAGGRLDLLTRDRAKPAVPYGGTHRLIDFPLSNCLHSGITDVWVVEQFNAVSLSDHLSNGRPWDLDRTTGGLLVLHPQRGSDREGWHQGTADALWRQATLIRQFNPDALVVASADAVYRLDYQRVVAEHVESGATATMVTMEVEGGDAGRYGVVQVADGQVTDYAYKPDRPTGRLVCNEVFVFEPPRLLELLDELGEKATDDGLEDLGDDLLPRIVDEGGAREHRMTTYWRDVGTVDAYWESHQDLLSDPPAMDLDDPDWPIRTRGGGLAAAHLMASCDLQDVLVAPGVEVGGSVSRSVLSSGAVVEPGAVVRDSVLLPGARVMAGAHVTRSVIDDGVVIGRDASVGGDGDVALVGVRARVPDGHIIAAGGRYPDEDGGEQASAKR
jgi:glucose-1-phosphate adenylyltransferase